MMNEVFAACLLMAAQTYAVPPAALVGIYQVEGGRVGQEVRNSNGSYDLGPMQINTIWMPQLAKKWKVSEERAKKWVRDDPCTNAGVAAWILKGHLKETHNLSQALAHYHSKTPQFGSKYKKKVVKVMYENNLVKNKR
ncbi:MAG: lytic transglycosylase domain-containing protein [Rhodospirillales bacterium]|nr:lytic transglycosylase domain-containing protein [Rhodospirillales bacterium]